ncbi:MAG: preprotein translocase subunit YajC [Gammaproteobacteria bacterium]
MSDFFISAAYAQSAAPQGGGGSFLIMMVLFFVIFYFMLIRPQMKQAKEHKKLIENLGKGDEVVTSGGMLGRIIEIGDNFIVLEVARETEIKVQKNAVSALMPKGTMKSS